MNNLISVHQYVLIIKMNINVKINKYGVIIENFTQFVL